VSAIVKIQLPAGAATPAPPVGTALGPHGVQTMEFVRQYNAATENQRGTVIPVEITIYEDRTFTAGIDKGATTPGRGGVGTITPDQLADIARTKMPDLNANDLEAAMLQIEGTARSMGISVAR
jgi:large subunit ribosomal protein L11